jgi:hypothetical protein
VTGLYRATPRRTACAAGMALGAVLLACGLFWWLTRLPQIGGDETVVKAVDALFTAVTARDETLLGQCEERLRACKDAGKLPARASGYLDGILQKARAGHWESAAQRLYAFMRAQHREGPRDQRRKTEKSSPTSRAK